MRASAPDGSSPRVCTRVVELSKDFWIFLTYFSFRLCLFIGCATALPIGVAPESLGDRWRSGEDLINCLYFVIFPDVATVRSVLGLNFKLWEATSLIFGEGFYVGPPNSLGESVLESLDDLGCLLRFW